MCGIAGYVGNFDPELLLQMNKAQSHRGPDGQGVWSDERVGLAHVRLAILDLSAEGRQPMWNQSKSVVLSYNGEIYNYRELRRRLEHDGVVFKGSSDTEVLVELLARYGEKCLPWLNGIFAFAAWFPAEKRMLLVRDASGVKPLYWAQTANGYVFASEIKALRSVSGIDWTPDAMAIAAYVSLLYAPGDLTPARGIHKLQPGELMELSKDSVSIVRRYVPYPNEQTPHDLNLENSIEACRSYLQQAVRRQLVSDVPIGAFLSGGVDSTALAAQAVKILGHSERYPCFTIGTNTEDVSLNDGFVDDYPYAKFTAAHLGVPLYSVNPESVGILDVDRLVWFLDEPTPDPAAFMTYAISQQARSQGVKVLLSGTGGDDLFTGYRRHLALSSEFYWGWWPKPLRSFLRHITAGYSQLSPFTRRLSKLFSHADSDPTERLASYFLWLNHEAMMPLFSDAFREQLGMNRPTNLFRESISHLPSGVTRLSQMLHLDRSFFLTSHNLNYTDKMGMACGIEIRVPLLDPDLVSFAERLKDSQRICRNQTKFLFRKALKGIVPDKILNRPKTGFGLPLRQLFLTTYATKLQRMALDGRLDETGIFCGRGVLDLLEAQRKGQVDATYPLLGVLCIESWIRQFAQK